MEHLPSNDPERQTRVQYNGKTYSIVDLTMFPKEADGQRYEDTKGLLDMYKPYQFELADVTEGVDVLERFKSVDEALKFIKENG